MSVAVRELAELPPPQLAPEVQPYLDGDAAIVYEAILRLSLSQARRMGVDIQDVRVFRKHSWEEDFSDTVVQLFVDTDFSRSLALWDSIGDALGRWQAQQPQRIRKILAEDFTVFVETHADIRLIPARS